MAKRRRYGTTGGLRGPGPQNLGRGNLFQGLGAGGKPTQAYQAQHPAPPPPDPAYEAWKASQAYNATIANADATYQRGDVGYQTGYGANGARDYTNPYSQAALYEESYKRAKAGTTNSMASQGQLYSGAYGRAQGENARNLSINENALAHAAGNAYHGIDVNQATGNVGYGTTSNDQGLAALLKALGIGS